LGDIGLRPDDFYEMTFFEYQCVCEGYDLRQARDWDKIRTIGFFIFKSVGDKKSQSPRDIMNIPVLDGGDDTGRRDHLVRRLMEWKLKQQQKLEADAGSGVDSVKNTD
jgi:hypothetical protein